MIIDSKRHSLIRVIGKDLIHHNKLPLLLLTAALISAIIVITITNKTRQLITEREQIMLERNKLDIEWRNLMLEENTLENHIRIECLATKHLQMQQVDPLKEKIVANP